MPEQIHSVKGIRSALATLRADAATRPSADGPTVALVSTPGRLHDGHLALVARAAELADVVVVSIIPSPLAPDSRRQSPGRQDFTTADAPVDTLAEDLLLLENSSASIVFVPDPSELFPDGTVATRVSGGDISLRYEGRARRGQLDGVLTVVSKLLNIVRPDVLVVGEKDAQQAFLIERMLVDLDHDVRLERVETVREPDGLAMSAQNRLLDDRQRRSAGAVPVALEAAASSSDRGPDAVITAAQSVLAGDPAVELDYLAVVDPRTFRPSDEGTRGRALVLVAVQVGEARLVDSARIALG